MVSIGDLVKHRVREMEMETGVLRDRVIASPDERCRPRTRPARSAVAAQSNSGRSWRVRLSSKKCG